LDQLEEDVLAWEDRLGDPDGEDGVGDEQENENEGGETNGRG
jgi:hypothetical protein